MDLLILGESLDDPNYRGTERVGPDHVDALPESHPANQGFLWYIESGETEVGPVHDLERARALIAEYRKLDPRREFELIEITRDNAQPDLGGHLLGFDVCERWYHSILARRLRFDPEQHRRAIERDDAYRAIAPLVRLFKDHFSERLNEFVLFPDSATAEFCRDCAAAMIGLDANLFDTSAGSLDVVGLYRLGDE